MGEEGALGADREEYLEVADRMDLESETLSPLFFDLQPDGLPAVELEGLSGALAHIRWDCGSATLETTIAAD